MKQSRLYLALDALRLLEAHVASTRPDPELDEAAVRVALRRLRPRRN